MPHRFLLLGADGMLGRAFRKALEEKDFVAVSERLDVRDPEAIMSMVAASRPQIVLNCAADTDVDRAQQAPERAFAVNAILPQLLARACHRTGARLVQFSSTGCYGAYKIEPYDDFDALQPTTIHHRSKLAGEAAVRDTLNNHVILRLGWLFGGAIGARRNFVWARLLEARAHGEIASDPSQIGNPTNVADVVAQTLCLLEADLNGTFNCVAQGVTSRFEYVRQIVQSAGLPTRLRPQRFERRAPVSPNEGAVNLKLDVLGLNRMPHWADSLDIYVRALLSAEGV